MASHKQQFNHVLQFSFQIDALICSSLILFQVSGPSSSRKLVVKVILGLVAFTLVAGVTLTAVYLGGSITKDAVKVVTDLFYSFFPLILR